MNTYKPDNDDAQDEELNALLASLPQPAPSSALDAAILADAEKALHPPPAANDSADGVLRTLPVTKTPDYLQRWRIPLGLAAAVLLTVNLIGVDWFGSKPAQFPVVGEPATRHVMPAPVVASTAAPVQRAQAMSAPMAERAAPLPPPARLDASVWLVKIDALLKAGEGALAQEEWAAFRQAYPDYPVAEELRQRLEKIRK